MGLRNETVAVSVEPGVIPGASGVPNLPQSWRRCCERLRAELGEDVFNSWFGRIELEAVANGHARLSVPTRFLKSWIDTHYLGHINAALAGEFGVIARILVVVRSSVLAGPLKPIPHPALCPRRRAPCKRLRTRRGARALFSAAARSPLRARRPTCWLVLRSTGG